MNVLLVCTGNTCFSVMAEGVLADMADRFALPIVTRSAGTEAAEDTKPTRECMMVMETMDIDVSAHRAHRLTEADVEWADSILCMTQRTRARILEKWPVAWPKVEALPHVLDDPYGQSYDGYMNIMNELRVMMLQWCHERKML